MITQKEIAIIILAKDEEDRLGALLDRLLVANECPIFIFDETVRNLITTPEPVALTYQNNHPDRISLLTVSSKDKQGFSKILYQNKGGGFSTAKYNSFADKRNAAQNFIKNHTVFIPSTEIAYDTGYKVVLHIDVDEEFDPWFLRNVESVINRYPEFVAFKFPRVNQDPEYPARDYPDYQVRLLKLNQDIFWDRDVHEVPFISRENGGSAVNLHDYMFTKPMDRFPIIHAKREPNKNRPWWPETSEAPESADMCPIHHEPKQPLHTCPYKTGSSNDDELCDCCETCINICANEI